jgi:hypothetical protein
MGRVTTVIQNLLARKQKLVEQLAKATAANEREEIGKSIPPCTFSTGATRLKVSFRHRTYREFGRPSKVDDRREGTFSQIEPIRHALILARIVRLHRTLGRRWRVRG